VVTYGAVDLMPSVAMKEAKNARRRKRRAALRAIERAAMPPPPKARRIFSRIDMYRMTENASARARGRHLDNLVRAAVGLEPIEKVKAATAIVATHGEMMAINAKPVTKRIIEPKYLGGR
jgi:hypothetical protein